MSVSAQLIFCDDIRQEITGKHLLIGVYGANIGVPQFPASFPLAIWMRLVGLEEGDHQFKFSITAGAQTIEVDGVIAIRPPVLPSVIAMPGIPITVASEGLITVTLSVDGEPKAVVGSITVMRAQPESAKGGHPNSEQPAPAKAER